VFRGYHARMVPMLVVLGVVVVLALGFYWTRGAAGPPALESEGRLVDAESSVGPLGEPMPWAEEVAAGDPQHQPTPEYIAEPGTPSEELWAREEARYRAKNEEKDRA
jgi:hypothetical protein